jgi:DNA-binding beta-propeller fold protein YncE
MLQLFQIQLLNKEGISQMKVVRVSAVPLLALGVVLLGAALTFAVTYSQIAFIPIPLAGTPLTKPLTSFDISWVDHPTRTYYLADRSNASVDVFSSEDNSFITAYGGFVGFVGSNDHSGPNGVLVAHPEHELWVADGDSTVKVIDLKTGQRLPPINTHGVFRADEMAFSQKDHVVLAANGDDDPPFVSLIDVKSKQVVATIVFSAANGVDAQDGIEQPLFDPVTHRFYVATPVIGPNPLNGGIVVINPDTRSIEKVFPVFNCKPHGLALGPHQHILLGCNVPSNTKVMDARDGSIIATITQVGGSDEVWFNPGDNRYYLAANRMIGGAVLGVIDAETNTWITNVKTGDNAHSVAVDKINNHIFVPFGAPGPTGVRVYAATGP